MGSRTRAGLCVFGIWLFAACGPAPQQQADDTTGDDDGGPGTIDARPGTIDAPAPPDGSIAYPDATPYPDGGSCSGWECTSPVDDGCNPPSTEICNNGTDEDCDGEVDEGCPCQSGAVQSCFRGPPGRRGVGGCVDGTQTCEGTSEFTHWGPCTGGITPSTEACDTQDNDCNGCVDDNPSCCTVDLFCPGPGDMPDGQPFQPYIIDGTSFWSGAVQSWQWTVTGGPCDQLFVGQNKPPSFTLAGANTSQLTFNPTLSGDYTVTVLITLPDGTTRTCTFIVHIGGPGLRVELCWDTTPSTDIDLHLHKPASTANWFSTTDDCYYGNCKALSGSPPNWNYANSPLSECEGGPEGIYWQTVGYCRNPRLDLDNIATNAKPENINIDVPANNASYRVMVHYYGGSQVTHPIVSIYCGGHIQATYGQSPDQLQGFNQGGGYNAGLFWRVVDVTTQVTGTTTTGCTLNPLHPPGMTTGYWLTNNVSTF